MQYAVHVVEDVILRDVGTILLLEVGEDLVRDRALPVVSFRDLTLARLREEPAVRGLFLLVEIERKALTCVMQMQVWRSVSYERGELFGCSDSRNRWEIDSPTCSRCPASRRFDAGGVCRVCAGGRSISPRGGWNALNP